LATYYIKEMRAVNESREFYLAGYSFGASVAFEMSLQLQRDASTSSPRALLLLDGSHNFVSQQIESYQNKTRQEREIDAIAAFTLQFNLSIDLKQIREKLTSLETWEGRMDLMSSLLKIDHSKLSHTIGGFLERFNMSGRYTPVGRYSGTPVLIKASNNPSKDRLGESYGLQDVCTAPVAIYEVEGTHDSFLEGKSAGKVADIISSHISS
jgi:fatty acid synthase